MNNPRLPQAKARRTYKNRKGSSIESIRRLVADWRESAENIKAYYDGSFSFDELQSIQRKDEFFNALLKRTAYKDRCMRGEWLLLRCEAHSPYEGCWCEPNFWFITPDLHYIHPLYVSHRKWLPLERKEMEEYKTTFRDFVEQYITGEYQDYWGDWELHVIKEDTLITEHVHPKFVPSVCSNFPAKLPDDYNPPQFKCSNCGRIDTEPHTHDGDYFGIGGVALATEKLYCESCMSDGCSSCGHPIPDGEAFYVASEMAAQYSEAAEGDYCEHCVPTALCVECHQHIPVPLLKEGFCEACVGVVLKRANETHDELNVATVLQWLQRRGCVFDAQGLNVCGAIYSPESPNSMRDLLNLIKIELGVLL